MKEIRVNGVSELDTALVKMVQEHSEEQKRNRLLAENMQNRADKDSFSKIIKNSKKVVKISKKLLRKIMFSRSTYAALATSAVMMAGNYAVDANCRAQGATYVYDKLIESRVIPRNFKLKNRENEGSFITYINNLGEECSLGYTGIKDYVYNIKTDALDDGKANSYELAVAFKNAGFSSSSVEAYFGVTDEELHEYQRMAYQELKLSELQADKSQGRAK